MQKSIWQACQGQQHIVDLSTTAWRTVASESEHATRRLVDSELESDLLNTMLAKVKTRLCPFKDMDKLHYLLRKPFRTPPLRHGSRFGTEYDCGIWYGSSEYLTTFYEFIHYRRLFMQHTQAPIVYLEIMTTVFSVPILSARALDLTQSAFQDYHDVIVHPDDYQGTQQLGKSIRLAEIETVVYPSARQQHGTNIAVFTPVAFTQSYPQELQSWRCVIRNNEAVFCRDTPQGYEKHVCIYP